MWARKQLKSDGFTVVELLIVIVVIGILATLTIIAYSGVQNQARTAALQSDMEQASKKLEEYKIRNNEAFPADLAAARTAGVPAAANTTQTYYYNATSKTYCLQTTSNQNGSLVQSVSSVDTTPRAGSCLQNGLIGWWQLNGNTVDSSGNGNDGVATNATLVTGQNGAANSAYSFASTGWITTNKSLLNSRKSFSMGGWLYINGVQGTGVGFIGQNDAVETLYNADGVTLRSWTIGGNAQCLIPTNTWAQYYTVWDGATIKTYLNGAECVSASATTYNNSTYFFNMAGGGISSASGNNINGSIDDIRLFNRALTSGEVQAIYSAGAS